MFSILKLSACINFSFSISPASKSNLFGCLGREAFVLVTYYNCLEFARLFCAAKISSMVTPIITHSRYCFSHEADKGLSKTGV